MYAEILIGIGFLVLAFLYWKLKEDVGGEIIVASLMSIAWVCFAGLYAYKDSNYTIYNLSIYPFILWVLALVLFKEFSEIIDKKCNNPYRYWTFLFVFWSVIMLTAEFIGYNWLGIQLGNGDPGLFGLPVLHIPWFGQLYYFFAGVVFVAITKYLKLK